VNRNAKWLRYRINRVQDPATSSGGPWPKQSLSGYSSCTTITQHRIQPKVVEECINHKSECGSRCRNNIHNLQLMCDSPPQLLLATGPGHLPAVRVRTSETVQFGAKPGQKPDWLHFGAPNSDLNSSTRRCCRVCLDPPVPISGSGLWVTLFMVAFRNHIENRKILTLLDRCPFLMYGPPLKSKTSDNRTLPHPENESQRRVNHFCYCSWGYLTSNWIQTFINAV
jgi:hypothetical protein